MTKLPNEVLEKLRPLEARLRVAASAGSVEEAIEITVEIQGLFDDRRHHRLLRAKLWAFETALDANRLVYAESGFSGVRKLSNKGTRIHLEASALLAVCMLRKKDLGQAKSLAREVIKNINDISSDRKRRQFQKRFVERIEQECLLSDLIGSGNPNLDADEMHQQAILLVQRNTEGEILRLIGNSIPPSGIRLLRDMRDYSIRLLPPSDQKCLPPPATAEKPLNVGKKAMAILKRIAWKSFCDPESQLYTLWSKQVPEVFNRGYFASALAATMASWRIGIPVIGAGVAAIAMRSTASIFCESAKPEGLMILPSDKDEG